jgi:hypothetical protein
MGEKLGGVQCVPVFSTGWRPGTAKEAVEEDVSELDELDIDETELWLPTLRLEIRLWLDEL